MKRLLRFAGTSVENRVPMVRVVLAVILGAALGISGTLAYSQFVGPTGSLFRSAPAATDPAGELSPQSFLALGTIEPRRGVLHLASPLMGSLIDKIEVVEGQTVEAGQTLILLDDRAAREELQLAASLQQEGEARLASEKDLAAERVAAAELALQQLAIRQPLQRQAQQAQLQVAAARRKQMERDVAKLEQLQALPDPLATEQQVEYQRVALEAAVAEFEAAEAAWKQLEQSFGFDRQRAESELRTARRTLQFLERDDSIQVLRRRWDLANRKLEQFTIRAPTNGTVLAIQAHPGELVTQQPLLQLADLSTLVCVAEVDADVVHNFSTDKENRTQARIRSRVLGDITLSGWVERVGNSAAQPRLQFSDPRQPVDRTVAKVIVAIREWGEPRPRDLAVLIGLQVEVELSVTATFRGEPNPP